MRTINADLYKYINAGNEEWYALNLSQEGVFRRYVRALEAHAVSRGRNFEYRDTHDAMRLNNLDIHSKIRPKQEEKNLAKAIYNIWGASMNPHAKFGRIIDFEVPLTPLIAFIRKDVSRASDDRPYQIGEKGNPYSRGNIDLLAVDDDALVILELKRPQSTEPYLRALLEGYTYCKTIKRPKEFLEQAYEKFGLRTMPTKIDVCPLLFDCEGNAPNKGWNRRSNAIRKIEDYINQDLGDNGRLRYYAFSEEEYRMIADKYEQMLCEAKGIGCDPIARMC